MSGFDDELAEKFSLVPGSSEQGGASSTPRWHRWKDRQERDVLLSQPSVEIPREYLAELIARGQAPADTMHDRDARDRYVAAVTRRALGLE